MKTLLRLLLKSQHQQSRSALNQTEKGMTLIELLIGTVMAFLIITPMLAFVVDMLNTDRREQVKSNTEQDLQAAVDFIAQDLSQAIYIYDNDGIKAITTPNQLPVATNGTPILVFWKRQQVKNAVPISAVAPNGGKPSDCKITGKTGGTIECNDTYVRSLVAYYQIKDTNPIWCQPSGGDCPTRIERYEIKDGVKNPYANPKANEPDYYRLADVGNDRKSLIQDPAFNPEFNFSEPTKKVTDNTKLTGLPSEVLVNYIDHSPKLLDFAECKNALGNPQTQVGLAVAKDIEEDTLKVTDSTKKINSFYACVDTEKKLARVTIRGNSLRRLQTDANYDASKSAFFPTATVQVQGLGDRGK